MYSINRLYAFTANKSALTSTIYSHVSIYNRYYSRNVKKRKQQKQRLLNEDKQYQQAISDNNDNNNDMMQHSSHIPRPTNSNSTQPETFKLTNKKLNTTGKNYKFDKKFKEFKLMNNNNSNYDTNMINEIQQQNKNTIEFSSNKPSQFADKQQHIQYQHELQQLNHDIRQQFDDKYATNDVFGLKYSVPPDHKNKELQDEMKYQDNRNTTTLESKHNIKSYSLIVQYIIDNNNSTLILKRITNKLNDLLCNIDHILVNTFNTVHSIVILRISVPTYIHQQRINNILNRCVQSNIHNIFDNNNTNNNVAATMPQLQTEIQQRTNNDIKSTTTEINNNNNNDNNKNINAVLIKPTTTANSTLPLFSAACHIFVRGLSHPQLVRDISELLQYTQSHVITCGISSARYNKYTKYTLYDAIVMMPNTADIQPSQIQQRIASIEQKYKAKFKINVLDEPDVMKQQSLIDNSKINKSSTNKHPVFRQAKHII